MSSTWEVFQKYYQDLIRCLPMDDAIFIGELFKNGLLPNDLKAKLNSLPTSATKATEFLDNIIKPDIQGGRNSNFTLLLSMMKNSEDNNMKKLADTIMSECDQISTNSGSTTGEYCIVCTFSCSFR